MVKCIAFEGTYSVQRTDSYGNPQTQTVTEYVIGTAYGVAHFKVYQTPGKYKVFVKVFTDLETKPAWPPHMKDNPQGQREALQAHGQYGRTKRTVHMAGGLFTSTPWGTTEDVWEQRKLSMTLGTDEAACKAWGAIKGLDDGFPRYDEIADAAELVVAAAKNEYLTKKAIAMAEVDDQWGAF